MDIRSLPRLVKEAASEWVDDKVMRLSASLAFYAIFSLAPLIIITIYIAGVFFGEEAARGQIAQQIQQLAGEQTANAIQNVVKSTAHEGASFLAALVGLVVLLFGASGAFSELKDALNTIWGVTVKPGRPFLRLIQDRILSFTMVLGIGFLLLISLVLSAAFSAFGAFLRNVMGSPPAIWLGVDFIVSFAIITVLFAMIFKILPDVKIRWRDVWLGAAGASLLFSAGKYLLGLYLGMGSVASTYGAAASAIIILLWIYCSACVLFLGAEFTKVYAQKFGPGIVPSEDAMLLLDAMKQKQEEKARANKVK